MILNFIQHPMQAHDFCDIICILCTVNQKINAVHLLFENHHLVQIFLCKIGVNCIARDALWPVLPILFYEQLPKHSMFVESNDSSCHTESRVHHHYFSLFMDWLCHPNTKSVYCLPHQIYMDKPTSHSSILGNPYPQPFQCATKLDTLDHHCRLIGTCYQKDVASWECK